MASGLARVAVSAAVLIAALAVACLEQLPRSPTHVCAIDEVEALPASGFAQTSEDCTSCLETPCCDPIGNCDTDCRRRVKAAHTCILHAGPLHEATEEQGCLEDSGVTDPAATNAYQCMRKTCGTACALPVCKVDPTYNLIANPACDQCMAGSCCPQLNACAADRGCKLVTDCIIAGCGSLFGEYTLDHDSDIRNLRDQACGGMNPDITRLPQCVQSCVIALGEANGGARSTDDPQHGSTCLGLQIVACGVDSTCNRECAPAATDAGTSDAASDAASDAGTD